MPSIEIGLAQRTEVDKAHAEYTRQTGSIETIVEGPPIFSGNMQSGLMLTFSQGFADFLQGEGFRATP